MKGNRYTENKEARQILCKNDIDPFVGCANLVVARNWCHSREYAKAVLKAVKAADKQGPTRVARALEELAEQFARCPYGGENLEADKYDEV